MEVFVGQPDLLDMDLHWLQDADVGLSVAAHFFAAHIAMNQDEMSAMFLR